MVRLHAAHRLVYEPRLCAGVWGFLRRLAKLFGVNLDACLRWVIGSAWRLWVFTLSNLGLYLDRGLLGSSQFTRLKAFLELHGLGL